MYLSKNGCFVIFGSSGHAKEVETILIEEIRYCHKRIEDGSIKNRKYWENRIKQCWVSAFIALEAGGDIGTVTIHDEGPWLDKQIEEGKVTYAALGIGSPTIRKDIYKRFKNKLEFPRLIHRTSDVDTLKNNISEVGVIIARGVTITTDITLSNHVQLNTRCIVCHDSKIDEFTIISPGAIICGNVTIGKNCYIGAGAIIRDGVTIADNTIVGMGAAVIKDITEQGTYIGVPAKRLK